MNINPPLQSIQSIVNVYISRIPFVLSFIQETDYREFWGRTDYRS